MVVLYSSFRTDTNPYRPFWQKLAFVEPSHYLIWNSDVNRIKNGSELINAQRNRNSEEWARRMFETWRDTVVQDMINRWGCVAVPQDIRIAVHDVEDNISRARTNFGPLLGYFEGRDALDRPDIREFVPHTFLAPQN